jgi:hypothetical protein
MEIAMKRMVCIAAAFALGTSVALADVTVDLTSATNNFLNIGLSLTLNFSVDGSGNVTLDANSSNMGGAGVRDQVNLLDGSVGTVSSGFNTSFSMVLTGTHQNGNATALYLGEFSGNPAGVGINGANGSRIDWHNSQANSEILTSRLFLKYLTMWYSNFSSAIVTCFI